MPDQANQARLPPVHLDWTDPHLPGPTVPGGIMTLTRSLTSGLTRRASDAPGVFWGVGDRGPNIKPGDAVERYGLDALRPLIGLDGARVMPLPGTGPALARFRLREANGRLQHERSFTHPPLKVVSWSLPVHGLHGETKPFFRRQRGGAA